MTISPAKRLDTVREYYFSRKLREIDEMNKKGAKVINLGIGSPDQPPHPEVIAALHEAALDPANHGYQSYKGAPVLRRAFAAWYEKSYGVMLDPDKEILPLIGSKEGIMHISMTFLNEGDRVLAPDPGYPTYRAAAQLAGATCVTYDMKADDAWKPDLAALEKKDLSGVKLMWVNYPHMPTGTRADEYFWKKLIAFARKHGILICHDNPYSFILNENPQSLLHLPGAKEVALELNSLSKSHNMAGWRVGVLVGNAEYIQEVLRFKSNMDSGMFLPLQVAAAKALQLDDSWYRSLNEMYRSRRRKVYDILDLLGCRYSTDQSGLFVWAGVPAGYPDGFALSDEILYNAQVFITPGGIFGNNGNAYIRLSLCRPEEVLEEALTRIKKAGAVREANGGQALTSDH